MISANTRKRIHAISIDGNVPDRYFAVTSEVPRNTVDARINAIPLNGRAPARTDRQVFVEARILARWQASRPRRVAVSRQNSGKFRIRECPKNDNCIGAATPENRTP